MSWLYWAPPGSTFPWAPVLLACRAGAPEDAVEVPRPGGPTCQDPDTGVGRAGIPGDCAAVRGHVQHYPCTPFGPALLLPSPVSWTSHPAPHTLLLTPGAVGGAQPQRQDRAMGVAPTCPHAPGRQRQAGSPVWNPASTQLFIDGVTSAAAATRAPVTSSVRQAMCLRLQCNM